MSELKITTVQTDLAWEDKQTNLNNISFLLKEHISETDLIILPEMFSTGFSMNAEILAEQMDGETINWMKHQAKKFNSAICGSIIINENENYYNRLIWISSTDELLFYDKKHLFSMGNEQKTYTAGTIPIICKIRDWNIKPLICYDLRFPAWCRSNEENHLTIFIANWPEQRISHWNYLLKSRAIENQCFVIGVNRIGLDDSKNNHTGQTQVLNPYGETIYQAPNNTSVYTEIIYMNDLIKIRRQYPFLKDSDVFKFE